MGRNKDERTIIRILKALSDKTRFKIVEFLLDGEKCVCEIIPHVKKAQSTVSIQLNVLKKAGILDSRREGTKVYYRVSNPKVRKILSKIDFSKWKGIDRKRIEWYPIIDEKKCIGCGMCVTTCGRGVFEFDYKKNKSIVKNPYNCMVGCDNCSVYCPVGAISFPQRNRRGFIQLLIKKYNLVARAKDELVKLEGRI